MQATPRTGKGAYTKGALASKHLAKLEHGLELQKAVEFVMAGHGGAQAASHQVEGCSKKQIEYAVSKMKLSATRPKWDILTELESTRLVDWIKGSAMNDNPVSEYEITTKVRKLLQARLRSHSSRSAPLCRAWY